MATTISMKSLLDAGMHFGHQTRRWNPKMRRFIWTERAGIYLIDLVQTQALMGEACNYLGSVAQRGGTIMFVGTKKQAQDAVEEHANRIGMPFVKNRWLGGLLTNWKTISDRLKHLEELRRQDAEGQLNLLGKKEQQKRRLELAKLETSLGGMAGMDRLPDAIVVVDMNAEALAVKEARRCRIPVIALTDTNVDPDLADWVVPGNDDAIRSCNLFLETIADAVVEARTMVAADEFEDAETPEATEDDDSAAGEPVAVGAPAGAGTDEPTEA